MAHTTMLQFYRDRAEQAEKDAEAATLSHVRDRCRRSQAAWILLAEKAELMEKRRVEHQIVKAASTGPGLK
jgi:hypothetical protein